MQTLLLLLLDWLGGALVSLPLVLMGMYFCDRDRFCRKWFWVVLLVLYLNAMYIIVGVPGIQYVRWDPTINLIPLRDFSSSNRVGMALNVVMFVPLGFLIPAYFGRYRNWRRVLTVGFLSSLGIELMQLFTFRATDVDDLLTNTLGAVLGFLGAKLLLRFPSKKFGAKGDCLLLVGIQAVVLLVILFVRYPLMELIWKLFPNL